MADAAAQGESSHARGRDDAARRNQAKSVRRMIHLPPRAAALDANCSCLGVDANALHGGKIYNQPIVADAQTATVMPAPADSEEQVVFTGEVDRPDDVGHVGATLYQARALVDHPVIDLASRLVGLVVGADKLTAGACFEFFYGSLVKHAYLLGFIAR